MSSQITVEKAAPLELGIYKVKFLICKISFFSLLQALLGKNLSSATDHLTILGQSMYTSELHVDSKLWTEWKWIFGKYFRLVCQLMLAEQTQILFYNSLVYDEGYVSHFHISNTYKEEPNVGPNHIKLILSHNWLVHNFWLKMHKLSKKIFENAYM